MTTPQQQDTTPGGEDLQVLISTALTDLVNVLPKLRELVGGHQRGLGFLTPDAAAVMDDLVRTERRDRLYHAQQGIKVTGESPAPGNLQAWTLLAEIDLTLGHLVRRITTQMSRAGICPYLPHRRTGEPDTGDLIRTLRQLTWYVTRNRLLELTFRDVEDLVARADRVLDGDDKARLDAPCPHCERNTLVAYFNDGVIRCDRDPKSGRFEDCVCPDPMCDCKSRPHYRHQWFRDLGTAPNGWWKLADRLNLTRIK